MSDVDQYLDFAKNLAKESGKIMLQYFDGNQHLKNKADGSPVTIADTTINDLVIQRVKERYPEHGVLGEEASSNTKDNSQLWVCDPVDGTIPYSLGIPTAAFSLALVEDGKPVVGVIYDPFLDRLYSAATGTGAFCNDKTIKVRKHSFTQGCQLASSGTGRSLSDDPEIAKILHENGIYLIKLSGVVYKGALCAKGKIDGFEHWYDKPHDIAAIKIIVEEAGGKVTDAEGKEQRYDQDINRAVISNGVIHDKLVELMQMAIHNNKL